MLKAVANRAYKAFVACALGAAVVLTPVTVGAWQWQGSPAATSIALASTVEEPVSPGVAARLDSVAPALRLQ